MEKESARMILKNRIRWTIVHYLSENGKATYSQILKHLGISTGKLNYHLRVLSPILTKEDGEYSLSELGAEEISKILEDPERKNGTDITLSREVSWLMLVISLTLLYFGASSSSTPLRVLSIISLFLSSFFFYLSLPQKFSSLEFIVILLISLTVSVFAYQLHSTFYPASYSTSLIIPATFFFYSAIFSATVLAWTLRTKQRWGITVLLFLGVTLIPLAVNAVSLGISPLRSNTLYSPVFPLPAFSLIIIALSYKLMKYYGLNRRQVTKGPA